MKRVTIGSVSYACPFEPLFRPLTADEARTLEESIAENGVQYAVKVCRTPTWGATLIDGGHRAVLSARLGKPCPKADLGEVSDELAGLLAVELNAGRRQLSAGELEQKRRERVERVAASRRAKKSLRRIADEEGISESQVRGDLERATAQGCAVDPEGGEVEGKDGRKRKAKRKKAARPEPPDGAKELDDARRHLRGLVAAVETLLAGPLGPALREAARRWAVPIPADWQAWPVLSAVEGAVGECASGVV